MSFVYKCLLASWEELSARKEGRHPSRDGAFTQSSWLCSHDDDADDDDDDDSDNNKKKEKKGEKKTIRGEEEKQ